MAWVLAPSLVALRRAFDQRFPIRDRATDGSIGDRAHQTSPSGHNPDDTPGSLPESHDADTVPEVRAIDVDADLREPGVTMRDVIAAILATPDDRDRLAYIIHDRTIWSRSSGWQPRPYYGDNPHTSHAHFSGNPAYDEDARPWTSVLNFGQEDDMDSKTFADLVTTVLIGATEAGYWQPGKTGNSHLDNMAHHAVRMNLAAVESRLAERIDRIAAKVDAGGIDVDRLAERVVERITGTIGEGPIEGGAIAQLVREAVRDEVRGALTAYATGGAAALSDGK